jgi:hypothetical protein
MTPTEYLGNLRQFLIDDRPDEAIAFARTARRTVSPAMTRDQKQEAATLLEHALMLQDPPPENNTMVVVCPPSRPALQRSGSPPAAPSPLPVEPSRPGS